MSVMSAAPTHHRIVVNNIELSWFEWGVHGDPVILMSHATGLHARCWASTVAHLDGYHAIAMDQRGHGLSGQAPPFDWQQLGADLTAFLVALELTNINGVGHSTGAHCMIQAALNEPDRFRCLTLFDPVIFEPWIYESDIHVTDEQHPVARRRNEWSSPQEMFDKFRDRIPFSSWTCDALWDYCEYGLVKRGNAYQLACPPAIEAEIYAGSTRLNICGDLGRVPVPVAVVRAQPRDMREAAKDFLESPTWPDLAGQFIQGEDIYLPEYSHFMPMEKPVLAASIIKGERQSKPSS
jgi:pimeloyl-ACP methyl ester carboxylesterase